LYHAHTSFNEMARDPLLSQEMLPQIDNERTRSWKIYYKERELVNAGVLEKRPRRQRKAEPEARAPRSLTESSQPQQVDFFEQHLRTYETLIGAAPKEGTRPTRKQARLREETVVISDLHVPDEREDLIAEVIRRHRGARLVIAGDLDDFEMLSRYDHNDWNAPTLQDSLARRDALIDTLRENFSEVEIMLGNHDLRLPRRAAKALGPDYAWISQQFLMWAYERRHGIKVITNEVRKQSGRLVPYLHYYHQIGDCVIGHVECAGRPVGKGVERAHDFFLQWKGILGLNDFRVVLQAHTHKQAFFRHPDTRYFCYEIGAMCDIPSYSLTGRQNYGPPQVGYYHLVQYNGVTDVNESRLISLD
jgi:hypothetical protein